VKLKNNKTDRLDEKEYTTLTKEITTSLLKSGAKLPLFKNKVEFEVARDYSKSKTNFFKKTKFLFNFFRETLNLDEAQIEALLSPEQSGKKSITLWEEVHSSSNFVNDLLICSGAPPSLDTDDPLSNLKWILMKYYGLNIVVNVNELGTHVLLKYRSMAMLNKKPSLDEIKPLLEIFHDIDTHIFDITPKSLMDDGFGGIIFGCIHNLIRRFGSEDYYYDRNFLNIKPYSNIKGNRVEMALLKACCK